MIDGINLSDHNPIYLNLKLELEKSEDLYNNPNKKNNIKLDWKKASQEYKILDSQILDEQINNLDVNENGLNCNNVKCSLHKPAS